MTTFTDNFPGSSLNPEWTNPAAQDDPTVSGGALTDPTGGATGFFALLTTSDFGGSSIAGSILIDSGAVPMTFIQLGVIDGGTFTSLTASYDPASGGNLQLTAVSGGSSDVIGALTGRYVLTLSADLIGLTAEANIYAEADLVTPVGTASLVLDSTDAALMGVPPKGFLSGAASDDQSYEAFSLVTEGDSAPPPIVPSGLTFAITTLRYPTVEPEIKCRLTQFTVAEVEIPINEAEDFRTAKVTLSMYDPAILHALPLERFLFVRYLGVPVFWGPILIPDFNFTEGTVTISAVSPAERTHRHFVRFGDDIEASGYASTDAFGISGLLDCARNTTEQTDRGVPDVGIAMGTDTGPDNPDHLWDVKRGDEVWASIQNLVGQDDGPDIELVPQELDQGNYVLLNTYTEQGEDKSDTLIFHYGWGLDNLDDCTVSPDGSVVVTHDHVLSADLAHRGTAAAEGPSARFGPYVKWDAQTVNAVGTDPEATLAQIGEAVVKKYGEPPNFFSMRPRLVTPSGGVMPRYLEDYVVGDYCKVVAKKGFAVKNFKARITKVTLQQSNSQSGTVQTLLDAVPSVLTSDDISGEE